MQDVAICMTRLKSACALPQQFRKTVPRHRHAGISERIVAPAHDFQLPIPGAGLAIKRTCSASGELVLRCGAHGPHGRPDRLGALATCASS